MQIIPAIDIIEGKCVRLLQGDYEKKTVYSSNPLDMALRFEDAGIQRLHLVDLDGARLKKVTNWKVLEAIATKTGLQVDFGGGVNSNADVAAILNSGAAYVTVGSIAIKNEALLLEWLQQYGAEKFILGADVKNKKIAIHGWLEETDTDIMVFIARYIQRGIQQIFCTDISKDGKMEGPSIELYQEIITAFPELFFIASGGVSNMDDVHQLRATGCKAAIIGKAIYEGKITLDQLSTF